MYRKLMFVMSFVVVLGLINSASADFAWQGGVSSEWGDDDNWVGPGRPGPGDWVIINTQDGPGAIYDPMITSVSELGGLVNVTGVKIGLGDGKVGHLTIAGGGSLTAEGSFARIHIGHEGSSGSLTIREGATVTTPEFGIGRGGVGVLNMTGGYLHIVDWWFSHTGCEFTTGSGHINLDGGLIDAMYLFMDCHDPKVHNASINITKGVMILRWGATSEIKEYVEDGLITGYNPDFTLTGWDETLNNVAWKWDDDIGMTIWAIPEPATVLLLGLGGLALIRKKR